MDGCALPLDGDDERVQLGHGAGARMTQQLLEQVFYPAFDNPALAARTDAAIVQAAGPVAFTTDAYVVTPWHFAGGNIGDLAVCGTVNDLAMAGAMPAALSLAFVIEEGFLLRDLRTIVASIATRCEAVGVPVVTGDTKVVERGKGDGVFITASGVGVPLWRERLAPASICEGDALVLSNDVGRHAISVQSARQGFVTSVVSDVAPLHTCVRALHEAGVTPHCLRDLTRGGLGVGLLDVAAGSGCEFVLDIASPPMVPAVESVVAALGLDGFFLANEGCFLAVVSGDEAEVTRSVMGRYGDARVIGRVQRGAAGRVVLTTQYGTRRVLRMPAQEPLPRIC